MTDFVDSNVIVYAHDAAEPAKREQALAVLSVDNWVVSAQVLSEFFVTDLNSGQSIAGIAIHNPFA